MFKARQCLDILGRDALGRLASVRRVRTARSLDDRRKILAHSYHGDIESLLSDVRRKDLIDIFQDGIVIDGHEYTVPGLARLSVDVLRELAIKVYVRNTRPRLLLPRPPDGEAEREEKGIWGTSVVQVLSTRHGEGSGKLTFDALQTSLRSARRVSLASAYFDEEFIDTLFRPLRGASRRPVVRLLFNGLAGQRLKDQLDQLSEIEKKLARSCKELQIRLKFEPGIFHSKLMILETESSSVVAFVGSANATMAALERNEELMIRIHDSSILCSYYDQVWEKGKDVEGIKGPMPRNLVSFFRTGVLFFRTNTQAQVTFNPFTKLVGLLSDEEKERVTQRAVQIPNAEIETGIGPFSLKKTLQLSGQEPRDNEDSGSKNGKKRPPIAVYSIETCLGYWVPTALREEFLKRLDRSASRKKKYWIQFADAVNAKPDEFFRHAFKEYREAIRQIFDEAAIDLRRHLDKLDVNPFIDKNAFDRYLKTLRERLGNPAFRRRLYEPYVEAPMPEIWDDKVTVDEFEASFFEYLEYVVNRPGKGRRVPSLIEDGCRYTRGASSDDIREALERRLHEEGWKSSDWGVNNETNF